MFINSDAQLKIFFILCYMKKHGFKNGFNDQYLYKHNERKLQVMT